MQCYSSFYKWRNWPKLLKFCITSKKLICFYAVTLGDNCYLLGNLKFLGLFHSFRRGHAVLRSTLPDKEEYVILVKMAPIQRQLYDAFINTLKEEHMEGWANTNPLKAFAVCCKVSHRICQILFIMRIWVKIILGCRKLILCFLSVWRLKPSQPT